MYMYGLTKDEYIGLLKECGMCTKKWTYAKIKMFNEKRLEIIKNRKNKKKGISKLFTKLIKIGGN